MKFVYVFLIGAVAAVSVSVIALLFLVLYLQKYDRVPPSIKEHPPAMWPPSDTLPPAEGTRAFDLTECDVNPLAELPVEKEEPPPPLLPCLR